ncbi:hypothetical protein KL918_000030 [Ogataea parapolymorpha]|uniref:Uncharacterized protein n=1 Tax=Ogataea parapolymorpha (strain ATCC 26012 / BCRC 20466 / JCM 22074 / NRRL Y-7560 / DL-1) TaxID=871575 RepID=W1Q7W7_OGAPD|nr:hypothetical protein HPODL_02721 [Ogataea parapolymorpha DL-1]ESW96082.1 hypothetical protein HPODL_02721 [Ogataea parapolymorpha DL-1]KAG7868019.1 hypothetical protein KL916_005325 [Ogataea parapolymorpha]KAG7869826.1 hypothetical protein KL918_000030 [Ogataea parapolymorpha]
MTSYRKVFSSISVLPIGENSADTIINSLSSSSSGPELSESPSANAKMRANRKEEKSIQSSVLAPIESYLDDQEEKKTAAACTANQPISMASTPREVKNTEASSWKSKIRKGGRKRRVVDSDDETPRKQQFDPNEVHCMGTASQPDLPATITDEFSLDPIITSSFIEGDLECIRRSQSPRCGPGDLTIQTEEDTTLVSNNNLKSANQDQLTGTLSSFLNRLRQMETFVVKRQRHMHQELEASEVDRKQLIDIISQTQEILGGLMPDKARTKAQQKNISKRMHLGP